MELQLSIMLTATPQLKLLPILQHKTQTRTPYDDHYHCYAAQKSQ
jgi:hypothetical protein